MQAAQQQSENIEAVLGRFQTWARERKAGDLGEGVRELSYEEALRSGRYRWQAYADDAAAEPEVRAREARIAEAAPADRVEKRAPAAARKKKKAAAAPVAAKAEPKRAARGTDFRDVLEARVSGLAANDLNDPDVNDAVAMNPEPEVILARAEPVEAGRQVALSVRLAASERAVIKTRAAEAGISASAYLRQCALEVEQLREQVQLALIALERSGMQASLAGGAAQRGDSAPGFFGRMKRRLFGGGRGAFALRA